MRITLPARSGAGSAPAPANLLRPDTRARVVGYLATAPEVSPGWRSDGAFVWPSVLATTARDHGQAPPAELFLHMRRSWFLLPPVVPAELLTEAAALVAQAGVTIDEPAMVGATEVDGVHDALLERDRETPPEEVVRRARLFDAAGPEGAGRFSPRRLRLPEPERRARLAAYLSLGRLVVRCTTDAPDPLDPRYRVRLGWRTDGVWVWPEALAHYVLTRGCAPELELLVHIERRGYLLSPVDDERARAAAAVALERPSPLPPPSPVRYLRDSTGALLRLWRPGPTVTPGSGAPMQLEALREDLRWGPPAEPIDPLVCALALRPVDEAEAVAVVDERWARADAVPALD